MLAIIDIGGTSIKYGVINPKTEEYEVLGAIDTNVSEENFRVEKRIDTVMDNIQSKYIIEGIAISTAGIVNHTTGEIVYANENLPRYKGTELKNILEEKYRVRVSVENDVRSALLGEIHFGKRKNIHSALMLTIGTGVGGALYLNNEIYHGFMHSAGEIGYAVVNQQNIEKVASTTALVRKVQDEIPDQTIDGRWIFEQAIHYNHPVCVEAIDELVTNLALVINNYISLLNPEVVILGGGIMEQTDYLKPLFHEKLNEISTNQLVKENTEILFASLGNKAGMLGAYSHFKKLYLE